MAGEYYRIGNRCLAEKLGGGTGFARKQTSNTMAHGAGRNADSGGQRVG
jgi:hypothetical protein